MELESASSRNIDTDCLSQFIFGFETMDNIIETLGMSLIDFKVMSSILLAYPVNLIYYFLLRKQSPTIQHFYFIVTGASFLYWTFGMECLVHAAICILVNDGVLRWLGSTFTTTCFLNAFQFLYLICHQYLAEDYVVRWTTAHCVLCLRLMGTTMDVYDGTKSQDDRATNKLVNALDQQPSLLELFSHCFFLGSVLSPQHSMKSFTKGIERNVKARDTTGCFASGFCHLLTGMLCVAAHSLGLWFYPRSYIISSEFLQVGYLEGRFALGVYSTAIVFRYAAVFKLTEGSCIITGLTYKGQRPDGTNDWSAWKSSNVWGIFGSVWTSKLIHSFNMSTNRWLRYYIYKRLRFLNNQGLSQLLTIVFLCLWHGILPGYILASMYEFLIITCERDVNTLVSQIPGSHQMLEWLPVKFALLALGNVLVVFYGSAELVLTYSLMKPERFMPILLSFGSVLIPLLLWQVIRYPLFKLAKKNKSH